MGARWRGHAHPDLYSMINSGPGPEASAAQTDYWNSLTDELAQVDTKLNSTLSNLRATWEGSAADSASTGMTPLQQWAGDAQTGSTVMSASTEDQAQFISTARAEMPKPVEVTTPAPSTWDMAGAGVSAALGNPVPAAAVALQAVDHEQQEAAQNAAEQKAVDTMVTYESNSTWNRDTLGTFVPPPDVVVSTQPAGSTGTTGGAVGSMATAGLYTPPGNTAASGTVTTPGTGSGGTGGRALPPTPGVAAGVGVGSGTGSLPTGGSTSPSTFLPPSTPGGGGLPGGGTPLPPGRTPAPGVPVGPGGLPLSAGGSPPGRDETELGARPGPRGGLPGLGSGPGGFGQEGGRGGAGGPGGLPAGLDADGARAGAQPGRGVASGLGAGGADGVLGRGGSTGTPGAGGRAGAAGATPMGGASGAGGDEDDEHYSPDYLLETTDVFGDDRMVSPAVIGEDSAIDEQ